jgi:putative transposase
VSGISECGDSAPLCFCSGVQPPALKAQSSLRTPKAYMECCDLAPLCSQQKDLIMTAWPHAPVHYAKDSGIFMVTAGTYGKKSFFNDKEKLNLLCDALISCCSEFAWRLQAWSVLSNHYHFIAINDDKSAPLKTLINKVHMITAKALNVAECTPGRRVWFQYWDSQITYEKSYLARLNYVHHNPVHHGVVKNAADYTFCSAAWFEKEADSAFYKTVLSFKTDKLNVKDDF